MKFNKLDVPYQWKDEFTKYPHGYTIFEALCSWTKQVDKMVDNINDWNDYLDNFVENFEFELQEEVKATITKWQNEGLLDEIIESALTTELDNVKAELSELRYQVKNESELRQAIEDGYTSISLKNDIVLTRPVHFDGVTIRFNLNGFKISLSDDFEGDYIFSIGYGEDINNFVGHERTAKYFFNGYIDCNDKDVFVFKYYFSWDFKCRDLRIERCGLGFIGYYPEAGSLATRGAECVLDNITIIASEFHEGRNIGFDIWFSDGYFSNLFAHYFTIGIRNRGSSNTFERCHVWGLPLGYPNSKKMAIGFENIGYYVNFVSCLADTPELLNENLPASYENGGIGFYDAYSSEVRYIGCEVLEHSASKDNSLYGWYLANEGNVEERYYGQSMYFSNCNTRRPSKLSKAIYYTGKRALTILGCNFDSRGRVRETNYLNSITTFFKVPEYSDLTITDIPENNTFKIINLNGVMAVVYKDNGGNIRTYFLRPYIQNRYTPEQLQQLKNELLAEKVANGDVDRTGPVITTLAVWNNETSTTDRHLIFWDRDTEKFYYAKDGTEVIF